MPGNDGIRLPNPPSPPTCWSMLAEPLSASFGVIIALAKNTGSELMASMKPSSENKNVIAITQYLFLQIIFSLYTMEYALF